MADFNWQSSLANMLSGIGPGLMAAGSSGWQNFTPAYLQGQANYQNKLNDSQTRQFREQQMQLLQQEADAKRGENTRRAAQEKAWNDFISVGGQPMPDAGPSPNAGPMLSPGIMGNGVNNGRPGGVLPQLPQPQGAPGGGKIYPGGPHDFSDSLDPHPQPHPAIAGGVPLAPGIMQGGSYAPGTAQPGAASFAPGAGAGMPASYAPGVAPGMPQGPQPSAPPQVTPQSIIAQLSPQQRQMLAAMPAEQGMEILAKLAFQQPEKPQAAPSSVQEYEYDKGQGYGGTYHQWLGEKAAQSRQQTTINMPAEIDSGDKELGKLDAQTFTDLQKSALQASTKIANYDRLGALLQQVGTGKYTGTMVDFKKSLAAAGIDPTALGLSDNMAAADAARPIINELALSLRNPSGGAGMPGALSDADRVFLLQSVPNLETSPDAVPLMVEYNKRLAQREREVAKVASQYRKDHGGHIDAGMYDAIAEFADSHPLFTIADAKKIQSLGGAVTPTVQPGRGGAGAVPYQTPPNVQKLYNDYNLE